MWTGNGVEGGESRSQARKEMGREVTKEAVELISARLSDRIGRMFRKGGTKNLSKTPLSLNGNETNGD